MKHSVKVTIILIMIFLFSQIFGLFTLNTDLKVQINETTGKVDSISYSEPIIGERPQVESKIAFWYILIAVLIGTSILLVLIKFNQVALWKTWFFLAVFLSISVSLGVFISKTLAFIFALIIAAFKIFKPNFFMQNISEILIYTGIAVLFVPIFKGESGVLYIFALLFVISLYDMYSVWHSKHMIKMANFQTEAKLFAGLSVPYKIDGQGKSEVKLQIPQASNFKLIKTSSDSQKERIAILGGGDIAFPLLFSGVVMQSLVLNQGLSKSLAFFEVQIIVATSAIALTLLFLYGKKDRFYPAMPFISAGCFIGYAILMLIQYLI